MISLLTLRSVTLVKVVGKVGYVGSLLPLHLVHDEVLPSQESTKNKSLRNLASDHEFLCEYLKHTVVKNWVLSM